MNKEVSEVCLVGGAFLLAPVVGCLAAIPLFLVTKEPIGPVVLGTIVGMALYIGACFLHAKSFPDDDTVSSDSPVKGSRQNLGNPEDS